MLAGKPGIKGEAVVILGAGASRGEACADRKTPSQVLPPLDGDFFEQVQRVTPQTDRTRILLQTARELFGPVPGCTMEEYFTAVEFLKRLAPLAGVYREQPGVTHELKWDGCLGLFRHSLLTVLTEAEVSPLPDRDVMPPAYHSRLLGCLSAGDAAISFNYDVMADRALAQRFPRCWRYGPTPQDEPQGEVELWNVRRAGEAVSEVKVILLKMHGSVNWLSRDGTIELTAPPFHSEDMLIVPPAWSKDIEHGNIFPRIWRSALERLLSAFVLVIVGYSLPRTDMWAQALLRHAAMRRRTTRTPLGHLIIANPDRDATDGLVSILSPAIGPGTRLIRLDGMAELCDFLAPPPRPSA